MADQPKVLDGMSVEQGQVGCVRPREGWDVGEVRTDLLTEQKRRIGAYAIPSSKILTCQLPDNTLLTSGDYQILLLVNRGGPPLFPWCEMLVLVDGKKYLRCRRDVGAEELLTHIRGKLVERFQDGQNTEAREAYLTYLNSPAGVSEIYLNAGMATPLTRRKALDWLQAVDNGQFRRPFNLKPEISVGARTSTNKKKVTAYDVHIATVRRVLELGAKEKGIPIGDFRMKGTTMIDRL